MSDALKEMRGGALQKSGKRVKKREQLKQSAAWGEHAWHVPGRMEASMAAAGM